MSDVTSDITSDNMEIGDVLGELVEATGMDLDFDVNEAISVIGDTSDTRDTSDMCDTTDMRDTKSDKEDVSCDVTPKMSPLKDISPAKLGKLLTSYDIMYLALLIILRNFMLL